MRFRIKFKVTIACLLIFYSTLSCSNGRNKYMKISHTELEEVEVEQTFDELVIIPNYVEDYENCSICLLELCEDFITVTKCNHIFHNKCLDKWIENKNECPLCRGPIDITFCKKIGVFYRNFSYENFLHNNRHSISSFLRKTAYLLIAFNLVFYCITIGPLKHFR